MMNAALQAQRLYKLQHAHRPGQAADAQIRQVQEGQMAGCRFKTILQPPPPPPRCGKLAVAARDPEKAETKETPETPKPGGGEKTEEARPAEHPLVEAYADGESGGGESSGSGGDEGSGGDRSSDGDGRSEEQDGGRGGGERQGGRDGHGGQGGSSGHGNHGDSSGRGSHGGSGRQGGGSSRESAGAGAGRGARTSTPAKTGGAAPTLAVGKLIAPHFVDLLHPTGEPHEVANSLARALYDTVKTEQKAARAPGYAVAAQLHVLAGYMQAQWPRGPIATLAGVKRLLLGLPVFGAANEAESHRLALLPLQLLNCAKPRKEREQRIAVQRLLSQAQWLSVPNRGAGP